MTADAIATSTASRNPHELGLIACTALVVGNMIGSGIFLLPASLAAIGPISIAGWVVTSAGAIVMSISEAVILGALLVIAGIPVHVCIKWQMSRRQPSAGSIPGEE